MAYTRTAPALLLHVNLLLMVRSAMSLTIAADFICLFEQEHNYTNQALSVKYEYETSFSDSDITKVLPIS